MTQSNDKTPHGSASVADRPTSEFRNALVSKLPNIRRFSFVLCRDLSLSDDLVQTTCVRALERWQQFTTGTRMDSWLFSIMHSIWCNDMRHRNNEFRTNRELAHGAPAIYGERHVDGESLAIGKIELTEVLSLMSDISVDQAAALTIVCIDGLSYREAASVLGIVQGTLESRIARGRIALARLMEEKANRVVDISDAAERTRGRS